MAKGKSSASSGTRKKHARKAAHAIGLDVAEPQQQKKVKGDKKSGKKGKDKEPRKKVYIPPSKPAPVRPDPLDTLGIAQIIPAELLVVLRRLAKKDGVTKKRALEDLQADWVEKAGNEEEEWRLDAVVDSLPVWVRLSYDLACVNGLITHFVAAPSSFSPAPSFPTDPYPHSLSSFVHSQTALSCTRTPLHIPYRDRRCRSSGIYHWYLAICGV